MSHGATVPSLFYLKYITIRFACCQGEFIEFYDKIITKIPVYIPSPLWYNKSSRPLDPDNVNCIQKQHTAFSVNRRDGVGFDKMRGRVFSIPFCNENLFLE